MEEVKLPKISEILISAWSLIDTAEKWTKYQSARDGEGYEVPYTSKTAVSFCMTGSVKRAADKYRHYPRSDRLVMQAFEFLRKSVPPPSQFTVLQHWNDKGARTHADVADVFARAIKLAQEEEEKNGIQ